MIDPEDSKYTCTLSATSLDKAARELYEDPRQRLGAVQTLRHWIRQQSHLICRTDTDFLLKILRTAKFSQLRAREMIETYLTMKTKYPEVMTNLDSFDPVTLAFIARCIAVTLPKPDKEGRTVHIMRPGQMDLSNGSQLTFVKEMRATRTLDYLLKENNEEIIVNGEAVVLDCTGITAKHLIRLTFENNKDLYKIYQECSVGRLKAIYVYNAGAVFEMAIAIIRPFMKKKLLDRIHVHNTMQSMYEEIPMELWPDEYLPDDYTGPSSGPLQTLIDNMKARLLNPAFRARLLDYTSDKYKIDLKAKPNNIQSASFRTLNID